VGSATGTGLRGMIFGHNTNVSVGAVKYHVQTEDSGPTSALIDTAVYYGGRVLHRRTNTYFDLLPMDAEREAALKARLDAQHRQVLEEIRSGVLKLAPPAGPLVGVAAAPAAKKPAVPEGLHLVLVNAKSWLNGKHATLQVRVVDAGGKGIGGAKIVVAISGAAQPANFSGVTDAAGETRVAFTMPRLVDADAALTIEGEHGATKAQMRFQLRAKPAVPVS
jgi:hypothetical protein